MERFPPTTIAIPARHTTASCPPQVCSKPATNLTIRRYLLNPPVATPDKFTSPPAKRGVSTRRAEEPSRDAFLLRNQRKHGAHIRSPEIRCCSVEQAIVENHDAAIRVLS